MWVFLDNHPFFAAVIIAMAFILATSILLLVFKLIKNGLKVRKAKILGNEIEFGGNIEVTEKVSETEFMRDMLILCNSINQWQKQVDKQIEVKTKEVINSSIRFANTKIDNTVNIAKLEYGDLLKKERKELTQEDNYQIIIYGFLMDQVREELKDIICSVIREDHFEDKSSIELESIGENATIRAKIIFESRSDILNKEILEKIKENNLPKINTEANEIIRVTADKYRNLKTEVQEIIEKEEKDFKEVLKLKFPKVSEEGINNIVNYYN